MIELALLLKYVGVKLYRIDVNCIQTRELLKDNQMKTTANFWMDSDFNILLQAIGFSYFFYFHNTGILS